MSDVDPTARLRIQDLVVSFGHGAQARTVLHGVSTQVAPGRSVGIVGESGSGKSTLAKAIVGMVHAASGTVTLDGARLEDLRRHRRAETLRRVQYIPQDPYSSLNPVAPSARHWLRRSIRCVRACAETGIRSCIGSRRCDFLRMRPTATPISSPVVSARGWRSPVD